MAKKKILIVGGGIAGTTLAGLLQNSCDITLIEEGPEWRTIGYAVGIWKSGLNILRKLELPDSFWKKTFTATQGSILGSKGQTLVSVKFNRIENGDITQAITREDLHTALISKLHNVKVFFSTTVQSLEQRAAAVKVVLSDNRTETYNLVVGADGVYSKTRTLVFGKKPLCSYGWFAWGGYTKRKYELFSGWYALSGPGEFFLNFPLNKEIYTVGFVCHKDKFKSIEKTFSKQEPDLHKIFPHLNPFLKDSIDSIEDTKTLFFSELYFVKMKKWYKGRVVLAGDSMHARSPVSGMGTTLALEDAYVLADEIIKNESIDDALVGYKKRRQPRVSFLLKRIDFLEKNIMTPNRLKSVLRDILLPLIPTVFFINLMRKIFNTKI